MTRLATQFGAGLVRAGQGIYQRLGPATTAPAMRQKTTAGNTTGNRLSTHAYDVRDQMLAGTVYNRYGGYLNDVLRSLGKPCDENAPPVINYYNPVPAIVGCYSNALGGRLNEELKLETPDGEELPPALADAIGRIWRWSNLDTKLEEYTTLVANQGTAGVRIVAEAGESPRVFLEFDKPSKILDAEEDTRGNLLNVLLEYPTYYGERLGIAPFEYTVKELIGKEQHSFTVGGLEQLSAVEQRNDLGICPYVLSRFQRRTDDFFGRHAYEGSESAIHGINWGLSQLDEATSRAISETVFMAGAGNAPDMVQLGRLTAMYVKLANGVPAPELKYIVPQLPIGDTRDTLIANIELLYTRQPELILNALKLLSGTSGETLSQVLLPVAARVKRARTVLEDSLIRAIQIALSSGIMLGLWDLGTGTRTKEAADRAYDDGQGVMAFRFADRPALPETPQQQLVKAQANVAERKASFELANLAKDVSARERNRIRGYSEDEIEGIESEIAEQDVIDEDDDEDVE